MQRLYNELGKYFDVITSAASIDTSKETIFLDKLFKKYKVHSVLDIACGTGRHSVALGEKGYSVVGIDYSAELLKVARSKSRRANVRFLQQDVSNIKLGDVCDAAICMWSTFGELPYEQMLDTLRPVLKHEGILLIDVVLYAQVPTGSNHKTYTNKAGDVTIKTDIHEVFEGKRRISEITYNINGRIVEDRNEMDIFTETEYVE